MSWPPNDADVLSYAIAFGAIVFILVVGFRWIAS